MLSAVFLTVLLSTIFSSDIIFSLWTSPHRSGGAVNFTFYILFSVILFLILKNKDWQKLWNFSFIIGDLAVLFAMLQYFNVFPDILVSYGRPVSTLSNSLLFAIYLLLLTFPISSFIIREKSKKRFFYIASLLLFIFGIVVSGSRAAYLGLLVGAFCFLFFYPVRKTETPNGNYLKKLLVLKISAVIVLTLAAFGVYYMNSQAYIPKFLEKNRIFQEFKARASISLFLADPRFSAWQVSLQAVKEKPIFGWGPENQSIGFDKYYDPSLPYLTKEWGDWWDRAHNILLDLSIAHGLLFTIIYFSFFVLLFYRLFKIKNANTEDKVSAHALMATFLGYFITLLFGFDSVSTYLMLFFIIGYSLYLTSSNDVEKMGVTPKNTENKQAFVYKKRKPIFIFLFIILIIFLWKYNIKPLIVNAEINKAEDLSCDKKLDALEKMFNQKSFLDTFLRLTYAGDIKACVESNPSKTVEHIKSGVDALKYVSTVRPLYTRTWILLGSFNTILFANETDPQIKKTLYEEINYDFNKAISLSPKHQEIFSEWAKFYFAAGDYAKMKTLSEECVALNPDTNTCYWYLGLSEIVLGDEKNSSEHIKIAIAKGFPRDTLSSYSQLALVYTKTKNYGKLVSVYESLISLDPQNIQHHATLAFIYKETGEYKKAREEALKILELAPEAKDDINLFLKTLPY